MNTIFEGTAMWLGPDEEFGLRHAKTYYVEVFQMKNGKIRANIDDEFYVGSKHRTFKDRKDFNRYFLIRRDKHGN